MSEVLKVDPEARKLSFGEQTASLEEPFAALLVEALLTMLPAEKLAMMAPTTTRGYTLPNITQLDYDQLVAALQQINGQLQAEVLRTNFRARGPGEPLQAKILLADKSIVKGVNRA